MERRTVLSAAAAVAAPWLVRARAQTRMRRIGVLLPWEDYPGGPPPGVAEAWKGLGWIVGETLRIERRFAAYRMERMPELVDELLRRQNVEVLARSVRRPPLRLRARRARCRLFSASAICPSNAG
jgi:hypothetical protein